MLDRSSAGTRATGRSKRRLGCRPDDREPHLALFGEAAPALRGKHRVRITQWPGARHAVSGAGNRNVAKAEEDLRCLASF